MGYRKKTYEDYLRRFGRMSTKRKVPVLIDALEIMGGGAGYTTNDCIVLALAPGDKGMEAVNECHARGHQDNIIITE